MRISFRKISASLLLAFMIALEFSLPALAQEDPYSAPLENIKSKLQSENIAVVDFGASTEDVPADFVQDFNSLAKLRKDLGQLESKKSQITDENLTEDEKTQAKADGDLMTAAGKDLVGTLMDINWPDDKTAVNDLISQIDSFNDKILKKDKPEIDSRTEWFDAQILSKKAEVIQKIVSIKKKIQKMLPAGVTNPNAIFLDLDFRATYNKWGRLPERVSGALEEKGYSRLADLKGKTQKDLQGEFSDLTSDDITLILSEVNASQMKGEAQLQSVAQSVVTVMRNLIGAIAVIWIIVSGVRMIFAQGDETVITEQKQSITYAVVGLIAILLIERLVDILYGAPGEAVRTALTANPRFTNEVLGVVNFIKAVIGSVAIFMIVVSAIRIIFARGDEEKISKQRVGILWIAIGVVLMLVNEVVVNNIFIIPAQQHDQIMASNVTAIINLFGRIAQFLLAFVGVVALGLLVYGAAMMIANYGSDEMVEKGKKIIKNAIIGILVIISAYTIIATLIVFR